MRRRDVLRLAGETGADPRTIEKWARGEQVVEAIAYALKAAADKLGLDCTADDDEPAAAAGGS